MCIAIVKPMGVDIPKENVLKNCFENNRNGAGFMWLDPVSSIIRIQKGYMTWEDFIEAFNDRHFTKNDLVGMHFRITTSGGTSKNNCHPFPLSPVEKKLKSVNTSEYRAMVHNGIFGSGTTSLSDTQLFVRDILSHPYMQEHLDDRNNRAFLEEWTQGSRVAIFEGDGSYHLYGDWREDEGVFYSNTSYKYSRGSSYTVVPFQGYNYHDPDICPSCHGFKTTWLEEANPKYGYFYRCSCGALFDDEGEVWETSSPIECPKCGNNKKVRFIEKENIFRCPCCFEEWDFFEG